MLVALPVTLSCCSDDDNDDYGNFVSQNDRDFVMKAAMSNRAEISAGELAATKARDVSVKSFGSMMVMHHGEAREQLRQLASDLSLYAPDSLDAEHVALAQQLQTLEGRSFDSMYIHSQVKDHQVAIALFESEASSGNNERIRTWAAGMLPRLKMHLHQSDSLANGYR